MNTRIIRETPFENLFVQPVANDAGGSIGAAYYIYNCIMKKPRKFIFEHVYYGPSFTDGDYKSALESYGLEFEYEPKIAKRVARHLKEGAIVGWFQGRMEAGPRALGNRSMLADPRRKDMKDIINLKIKNREYFRPFAPSVLEDKADEYFDRPGPCPFMIMIADVYPEKKERIPAVTHVDGTARIQTVSKKTNPQFYELIEEFHKLTGVPVLLNTSFNENEPIVCTPNNAIECFLRTGLDILVLGNFIAYKK